MKQVTLVISIIMLLGGTVIAQDEFIVVNDFEEDPGTMTNWVNFIDITAPDEPVHSGELAAIVDIFHEGGWTSSIYTLPQPFDGTQIDEFRMWVYSDKPFRLRTDLEVELVMGFRTYTPDDVGKWKEFVYWISEEQSKMWEEELVNAKDIRFWINPSAATVDGVDYPSGFEGVIFIDDMTARKRKPVEREYKTIIGFNDAADEDLVSLEAGTYFEVMKTDDPKPTEGDGLLLFEFTQGWNQNITIDLKNHPEILDYDRIHLDLLIDAQGGWAASSLVLKVNWTDDQGNSRGTGWSTLSENIVNQARGIDWENLSGQYGPVDSEGFTLNGLKDEIAGVFDDPEGTITLTLTSQGAEQYDGATAYIDNIRLSRPIGTGVSDWELH